MNLSKLFSISLLAFTSASAMEMEPQVVIIGGGMSGLTAAHHLHQENIPAVIYEGRDRLGGRTHTHYFTEDKKCFYEEGGTFIDDDHYEAIKLAKILGVELNKNGFGSKKITAIFGDRPQKFDAILKTLEMTKGELQSQWEQVKNDHNAMMEFRSAGSNSAWHAKPLLPYLSNLDEMSYRFLQCIYQDESGSSLSKAPVTALPWLIEMIDEYHTVVKMKDNPFVPNIAIDLLAYNYTVKGGMSQFVDCLHDSIKATTPVHLSHRLTKIKKDGSYVLTFLTEEGKKKVRAEQVIMTLPFSTLRYVKIDGSVGLSDFQNQAIQTLSYGTNGKIGMPTQASQNIYDHMVYHLNLDDQIVGWAGEHAATLIAPAHIGESLDQDTANQIAAAQSDHIMAEHSYIKCFGNVAFKNWAQDPFSFGSYSTNNIDHNMTFPYPHENVEKYDGMRAYAEPVGNFFFAGEHTRADGTSGHIEGAIRSGIKAADLVKLSMK